MKKNILIFKDDLRRNIFIILYVNLLSKRTYSDLDINLNYIYMLILSKIVIYILLELEFRNVCLNNTLFYLFEKKYIYILQIIYIIPNLIMSHFFT